MAFSFQEYNIIDEIGRGAFGTVYRARQNSLNRIVAVKSLSPQRAQNQHDIIRFRQEAQAMASLSHDAIVTVYDYAFHRGRYYIVMEFVDGTTLEQLFGRSLPVRGMLFVLERITNALQCAHEKGIIHRDLKPNNILLGTQGQIKLADFGLAVRNRESSRHSSMAAATVGTLNYMAPEAMVSPEAVDWRVDVYALGCILYRVITGKLPFEGSGLGDISYKVLNEEPQPISDDHGFGELCVLIPGCLSKDREQRPSLEQLHDALLSAVAVDQQSIRKQLTKAVRGIPAESIEHTTFGKGPEETLEKSIAKEALTRSEKKQARWSWRTAIVTAVLLAAITVAIAIRQIGSMQRAELPELSAIERISSFNHASLQAPPENRDSIMQVRKGPQPITSVSPAGDMGVLVIRGLQPKDTIFIDNKIAGINRNKMARGIPAAAGMCMVEIKGADGRYVKKRFTIRPSLTTEWNLEGEDL